MFDLRTEAEMRLYSEKTAKELARKKQHEEAGGNAAVGPASRPAAEEQATAEANTALEAK